MIYDSSQTPEAILILPAYNEASRQGVGPEIGLEASIEKYRSALKSVYGTGGELVVVDDGSQDDTAALARRCETPVISYGENRGRGFALRTAFSLAVRQTCGQDMNDLAVGYTDADGSYDAETILRLFEAVHGGADVAVAYRLDGGHLNPRRQLGHSLLHFLCERVAPTGVRDPQAGAKVFHASVIPRLWGRIMTDGWAADREILHLARQQGLDVKEIGAEVVPASDSRVQPLPDSLQMIRDSLAIRRSN